MKSFKQTNLPNSKLWDENAEGWNLQVGDEGDRNRRFNSDPVLWKFLGEVAGRVVLDAGCGTGYLARKLASKGARATGVDYSLGMVTVAERLTREAKLSVEYRVDSCTILATVPDASCDKLVSNYVLQDLQELTEAAKAFYRVLRHDGLAVLVFSHPCFPQSDETELKPDGSVHYRWTFPYFEEHEIEEKPWGHLRAPIVYYQRPLSMYWRTFRDAGFQVQDFDEPVVSAMPPAGYDVGRHQSARMRPLSVAFSLRK